MKFGQFGKNEQRISVLLDGKELCNVSTMNDEKRLNKDGKIETSNKSKVKVPRWFDDWYKSFDLVPEGANMRLHFLARSGWGYYFSDVYGTPLQDKQDYVIENKKSLIRAVLDGYEVEEEYKEVDPFTAFELYIVGEKDVFSDYYDNINFSKVNASLFNMDNITSHNIKFYIKAEDE